MESNMHKLGFVELEPMDALNNSVDFTRGLAIGLIIGSIALT